MTVTEDGSELLGPPRWLEASLDVKEGRDPLGLQTTTQDRLMPYLLPGILELSRRARYFSFHAYLLRTYRDLKMAPNIAALSDFIKRREWDLGLAVMHCPLKCGSSPVGASSLRAVVGKLEPPYPREESVESALGGYGLYYRSPMTELGLVARPGEMVAAIPITVDVLRDTDRAQKLAETFAAAVEDTAYVRQGWMQMTNPMPLEVLQEYAEAACLCQLRTRPDERDAVHQAIFGEDADQVEDMSDLVAEHSNGENAPGDLGELPLAPPGAGVTQRRRSVAHYLSLIDRNPLVVETAAAYREGLWSPPPAMSAHHSLIAGQWAGLVAKDVWQDALCSIWSQFCWAGVTATQARSGDGLASEEVRALTDGMLAGPPALSADLPTVDVLTAVAGGGAEVSGLGHPVREAPLEALRAWTAKANTATSALVVIMELHRRAADRRDPGWVTTSHVRSAWQPSLADVLTKLTAHLEEQPSVDQTLWWLIHQFILGVHERIAYSKMPEHTFRFRWEDGLVRFFDHGIDRFPLAAIRFEPLASITHDLGLWDQESPDSRAISDLDITLSLDRTSSIDPEAPAILTARGRAFVLEVLR